MNEKAISVFEQYDLEPKMIFKQRGSYGCKTDQDKYLLMEYDFSEEKLNTLFQVQDYLEKGNFRTEKMVANRDGKFISVGEDGFGYALKKIYSVEECDIQNGEHIQVATKTLGAFHKYCRSMEGILKEEVRIYYGKNLLQSYHKHNKEMINIRNYIVKRRNKNFFEREMQKIIDGYYCQGKETLEQLETSTYPMIYERACQRKQLIHGNYNQHALGFENQKPVFVNLTKVFYGPRINDLYGFIRKVLEKNEWNVALGHRMLKWYEEVDALEKEEKYVLKYLLAYPEKFWKIINYYYNSNKAWYSEKNEEKLRAFRNQEEKRWKFIKSL